MTDIVDTAINAGSFNTLVDAVKAADLVDTLNYFYVCKRTDIN